MKHVAGQCHAANSSFRRRDRHDADSVVGSTAAEQQLRSDLRPTKASPPASAREARSGTSGRHPASRRWKTPAPSIGTRRRPTRSRCGSKAATKAPSRTRRPRGAAHRRSHRPKIPRTMITRDRIVSPQHDGPRTARRVSDAAPVERFRRATRRRINRPHWHTLWPACPRSSATTHSTMPCRRHRSGARVRLSASRPLRQTSAPGCPTSSAA